MKRKFTLLSVFLLIFLTLGVLAVRPDLVLSAETKVTRLTQRTLADTDNINEVYKKLSKYGATLNLNEHMRTDKFLFQVKEIKWNEEHICVLITVQSFIAGFDSSFRNDKVISARTHSNVQLRDNLDRTLAPIGFNSSTDAVSRVAKVACYSFESLNTSSVTILVGNSATEQAEFVVDLSQ